MTRHSVFHSSVVEVVRVQLASTTGVQYVCTEEELSVVHSRWADCDLLGPIMPTFLRTIEFLALSLWLGSDVFLSFVLAPGAFRILASRDQAGAMVGYGLWWMHMIGVVCGITIIVSRLTRTRAFSGLVAPAALCVLVMIGLTVISQHAVSPKMAALRMQMGSIQATAANSPLLAEFSRLHRVSVSLESGVLLAGIAAMLLMVKEFPAGR
jgi:hypothetical protein